MIIHMLLRLIYIYKVLKWMITVTPQHHANSEMTDLEMFTIDGERERDSNQLFPLLAVSAALQAFLVSKLS